jgi:hypothetical protein
MPESRQATCKRDFTKAASAWETVLKPWLRQPGDPEPKFDVVYGVGRGKYDGIVNMYRSMRFLETVAANSAAQYKWPHPNTLKMESCGHPAPIMTTRLASSPYVTRRRSILPNSTAPTFSPNGSEGGSGDDRSEACSSPLACCWRN